jgi:hypothetical protein
MATGSIAHRQNLGGSKHSYARQLFRGSYSVEILTLRITAGGGPFLWTVQAPLLAKDARNGAPGNILFRWEIGPGVICFIRGGRH